MIIKLSGYSAFSIFSNVREVNLVYPIHNGSCHKQQMINNDKLINHGNKGNNKITELRTILQRESPNSNSEQSYKGKVQTHNYINRQNQSTTGKL